MLPCHMFAVPVGVTGWVQSVVQPLLYVTTDKSGISPLEPAVNCMYLQVPPS